MNRRSGLIAAATAAACLLFAAVSTSGGVGLWGAPQWDLTPGEPEPVEAELVEVDDEALLPADDGNAEPFTVPAWIRTALQLILIGLAAALAVALLLAGWRRRPRVRWRRRADDADFEVLPDVAAVVVEQAAAQRAELLDGAPRNAIVRCWLQLELDVAAAGLPRDPADTSLEFTERVLARYSIDSNAISDLARRYREARFSDHELGEADREAALASLDRLHRTLEDARATALIDTAT